MAAPMSTHVKKLSKEIRRLLDENKALTLNDEKTKICCSLSGHEMPVTESAILTYINGKKYKKLLLNTKYDHSAYDEHIVYSTKKGIDHLLFCNLTLRHINDAPVDVEVHVRGRKFQKALAWWQKCQETGETFKPLSKFKRKGPSTAWDRSQKKASKGNNSESDHENEEDDQSDDLGDLYPEADFASSDEEETVSSDEEETMKDDEHLDEAENDEQDVETDEENSVNDEGSDLDEMDTSTPTETKENSEKLQNSFTKLQPQNDTSSSRKRSAVNNSQTTTEGTIPKKKHKKKLKK